MQARGKQPSINMPNHWAPVHSMRSCTGSLHLRAVPARAQKGGSLFVCVYVFFTAFLRFFHRICVVFHDFYGFSRRLRACVRVVFPLASDACDLDVLLLLFGSLMVFLLLFSFVTGWRFVVAVSSVDGSLFKWSSSSGISGATLFHSALVVCHSIWAGDRTGIFTRICTKYPFFPLFFFLYFFVCPIFSASVTVWLSSLSIYPVHVAHHSTTAFGFHPKCRNIDTIRDWYWVAAGKNAGQLFRFKCAESVFLLALSLSIFSLSACVSPGSSQFHWSWPLLFCNYFICHLSNINKSARRSAAATTKHGLECASVECALISSQHGNCVSHPCPPANNGGKPTRNTAWIA